MDEGYLSVPRAVEFPTEGGLTAFMNYYPPANKDYALPPGELPPLLIKIHGGPTSQASTGFSLGIQYWTSRGGSLLSSCPCPLNCHVCTSAQAPRTHLRLIKGLGPLVPAPALGCDAVHVSAKVS